MLKGLIQSKNTREKKKRSTKSTPNNQENGNRNIYANNYFKCKWINTPTKRHRLVEWIQKQDPFLCCLQETHFRPKDIQTESERMEKYIPCKWEAKVSWRSNP